MSMTRTILFAAMLLAPMIARADTHPACRKQLIRYCISMYAGWDMPPALGSCITAMEPPPGVTPAWYTLRGEIQHGTIPPLAAYTQCLDKSAAPPVTTGTVNRGQSRQL